MFPEKSNRLSNKPAESKSHSIIAVTSGHEQRQVLNYVHDPGFGGTT